MSARNKAVETARVYLGCKESNGSHKKIIDLYNSHKPLARGYEVKYTDEWCATFVSAVSIACGLTHIMPTECSCARMIALYQKLGRWEETDSYTPRAGDVIFYDWQDSGKGDNKGNPDHVGIVESVSNGIITVIEGNYSRSVKRRKIAVGGKYIRGYCLPNYESMTQEDESMRLPKLRAGRTGQAVRAMQGILIASGYSCGPYGADGKFGEKTYEGLRKFQQDNGLTVDGICGPDTWAKLLGV